MFKVNILKYGESKIRANTSIKIFNNFFFQETVFKDHLFVSVNNNAKNLNLIYC